MAGSDRNTVQSVAKALGVLCAFTAAQPELTMTEVANAVGIDRGTAFRMVHTLVNLGYLAPVPATRRFHLTLKCLEMGFTALAAGGLPALCRPLLREMVPALADAASLGMLSGPDVVYLERVNLELGRQLPDRPAGSRTGAYAAALGHAILAWTPAAEVQDILQSRALVALSPRTLTDIPRLTARLEEVRAQGFAVADGENAYGVRSVAAPIFWPDGTVRAAVSLTARSELMALDDFVARAVPPLLVATRRLSGATAVTDLAA